MRCTRGSSSEAVSFLPSGTVTSAALLELAEAGQFTLHCDYCDFTWTPDIQNQKANADSLQRITQV
jgi:hypothetical protein